MLNGKTYIYIIFILLLSGLFACSSGEDPVVPPVNPPEVPEEPQEKPEPYFITVTDSLYLDRTSYGERMGASAGDAYLLLLPEGEIRVDVIRYRSVDPAGNPLEASGTITYPKSGTFKGLVVGEHYSIGANREAPSSTKVTFESALALFGYVVINPDYLGFGSTVNLPQPYLHAESSGRNSVDMLLATYEYMDSLNRSVGKELNIIGYSQGAYTALALQKMIEEEYTDEISIRKVFAGGGPYDPITMFDVFVEMNESENPPTIPLTIVGIDYAEQLDLNYTNIFKEPLLSNYKDWFVSKEYSLGQLRRLLDSDKLTDFMHPDMFTEDTNEDFKKVREALKKNSLIEWTPKAPIVIVHGVNDTAVPFISGQPAYEAYKSRNCPVEFREIKGDHKETAIPFYLIVLQELVLKQ